MKFGLLAACFLSISCSSMLNLPLSKSLHYQHQIYYQNGVEALRSGMCSEAIFNFRKALRLEETPKAWNNLGIALEACGRLEEALEAYKNAEKIADSKQKIIIKTNIKEITKLLGKKEEEK